MKKNKAKFFVDIDSLFSHGAIIFFLLSCVFCLLGSLGRWDDRFFIISQVFFPVICSLAFVFFLKLFGRRLFWMTCIPVVAGLAFFVIKALAYGRILYTVISIALSVLAVFLYTAAVFGWMRVKWPLIPVFILGFFFNVFVKGYYTLRNPDIAVSFSEIMLEISVLFIILAMLFVSFAMKNKRSIESLGLPKIRAPKVIVKNENKKAETEAAEVSTLPEAVKEEALAAEPEVPTLESGKLTEIPEVSEEEPAVSEEIEKESEEIKPDTGAEL